MLEVKNLEVSYGAIKAIKGVDLKVEEGEIVAFIGANGAGKTTILRTISGLVKPEKGTIFLDEPAAGMNPIETEELMETIKIVREKFKTAVLLIEHDMKLVMGICEWIKVISFGKEIATGTPDEIKNNKEVITAYLGE